MEPQTYSLFQAMGSDSSRESLELLLAIQEQPDPVKKLAARTGISKATISRRLTQMSLAGLVSRDTPNGPFYVTCETATTDFLGAASALSSAILESRKEDERRFSRRVRKTRYKTIENEADGSSSA